MQLRHHQPLKAGVSEKRKTLDALVLPFPNVNSLRDNGLRQPEKRRQVRDVRPFLCVVKIDWHLHFTTALTH